MLTNFIKIVKTHQNHIFLATCMLMVAIISFNIGKINSLERATITFTSGVDTYTSESKPLPTKQVAGESTTTHQAPKLDLRVVASKNSDKYHFVWCSSAKRIKEENKLWFINEAEAQKAGYTLAGNCTK